MLAYGWERVRDSAGGHDGTLPADRPTVNLLELYARLTMTYRSLTRKGARRVASLAFVLMLTAASRGSATTIDFEGFPDSTILTNQYAGVTFSNAIILTAGISLNEFEFPPHSGANVVADNVGPMAITFANPVTSFSGYFTYAEPLIVQALNAANVEVASATSLFSTNDALFGDPGSSPNEFIQVAFESGISNVTITGGPNGESFTLDDVAYSSPTPEPAILSLILAGGLGLVVFRRWL